MTLQQCIINTRQNCQILFIRMLWDEQRDSIIKSIKLLSNLKGPVIKSPLNLQEALFDINESQTYGTKMNDNSTYIFSSPTIQMADSSFTTSVIMAGWAGSMALASSARHFSSPRILSRPYCRKHKPECGVILPIYICEMINKKKCHWNTTVRINHLDLIGF